MKYYGTTINTPNRRRVIRRNYRWLRERGLSRDLSKIVIDSTARAAILSADEGHWAAQTERTLLKAGL